MHESSRISSGEWGTHVGSPLPIAVANSPAKALHLARGGEMGADLLTLPAGARFPAHAHPGNHALIVLDGEGFLLVGDERREMRAGMAFVIPGGAPHATAASPDSDLTWISVGMPYVPVHGEERMAVL